MQGNGTCVNGCVNGFYGHMCETPCTHEGCEACDFTGECVSCKQGKWGQPCDNDCSQNCMPNATDSNIYCERSNGFCSSNACAPGFYLRNCTSSCSSHCGLNSVNQRLCDFFTGRCIEDNCEETWYGPTCLEQCPANCFNQSCDRIGNCLLGCKTGYWGVQCTKTCNISNTCNDGTCDQTKGSCLECENSNPSPRCRTAGRYNTITAKLVYTGRDK